MTTLTLPSTTALLVIDLQLGTTANPTAHPLEDVLARSVELLAAFRSQGLPVVLATVTGMPAGQTSYGGGGSDFPPSFSALRPELDAGPADLRVSRRSWSAFAGTELAATLRARGVTTLVLAGLATSFGVESTARHGYDLGFDVLLAHDAMSDPREEAHEGSLTRVFPALGRVVSAAQIIAALPG